MYRHFSGGLTFSTTRAISSGEASTRGGMERGGRPMRLFFFGFVGSRFGIILSRITNLQGARVAGGENPTTLSSPIL